MNIFVVVILLFNFIFDLLLLLPFLSKAAFTTTFCLASFTSFLDMKINVIQPQHKVPQDLLQNKRQDDKNPRLRDTYCDPAQLVLQLLARTEWSVPHERVGYSSDKCLVQYVDSLEVTFILHACVPRKHYNPSYVCKEERLKLEGRMLLVLHSKSKKHEYYTATEIKQVECPLPQSLDSLPFNKLTASFMEVIVLTMKFLFICLLSHQADY